MNTPYKEMIAAPGQTRIVFVHVGKCAGGSVIHCLRHSLTDRHVMYEMHTDTAAGIIRDTLASQDDDFIYLIALRDPIARFVSAFDWCKHSDYLTGEITWPAMNDYFAEFRHVDTMARALSSEDSARADRALTLARFAHMGLGQAWYIPRNLVEALPEGRTYLCETETLERDLQRFAAVIDSRYLTQRIEVPHDKFGYKNVYDNPEEVFGPPLSEAGRRNLRILLNEDYTVQRALKKYFDPYTPAPDTPASDTPA